MLPKPRACDSETRNLGFETPQGARADARPGSPPGSRARRSGSRAARPESGAPRLARACPRRALSPARSVRGPRASTALVWRGGQGVQELWPLPTRPYVRRRAAATSRSAARQAARPRARRRGRPRRCRTRAAAGVAARAGAVPAASRRRGSARCTRRRRADCRGRGSRRRRAGSPWRRPSPGGARSARPRGPAGSASGCASPPPPGRARPHAELAPRERCSRARTYSCFGQSARPGLLGEKATARGLAVDLAVQRDVTQASLRHRLTHRAAQRAGAPCQPDPLGPARLRNGSDGPWRARASGRSWK
jgi:hypothetical protein